MTIDQVLKKIEDKVYKLVLLTQPDVEEPSVAVFFNINDLDEAYRNEFLEDTVMVELVEEFEDLDFNKKIIFGIDGVGDRSESVYPQFAPGVIYQPHHIFLADLENGTEDSVLVYRIDIDGGMIPGTLTKIADDITELELKL